VGLQQNLRHGNFSLNDSDIVDVK